jgi:hypothetical protein
MSEEITNSNEPVGVDTTPTPTPTLGTGFPLEQYGITPEAAQAFISYLLEQEPIKQRFAYIDERRQYHALKPLRDEWGENFDTIFAKVQERFRQLPPHLQAIYDNTDGARFLYQQLLEEEKKSGNDVPKFDRGTGGSGLPNGRYRYKQSEILAMKRDEYQKQARDIQQAYAQGLVDMNG